MKYGTRKMLERRRNKRPTAGIIVTAESSDRSTGDASRAVTPQKIDAIMRAANSGDTALQCQLALELEEKNWDIAHAVQTRRQALLGVKWDIVPGGESPADKKAAEDYKAALESCGRHQELDGFDNLLADLSGALLPGFAVAELVWGSGGSLAGFQSIEQRHFSFVDEPRIPRLVTTDHPSGIELDPVKFLYHNRRVRGGDPARGGLIRPLAWLHCFSNLNLKDLLRFIERYGMPFTVARVDQQSWDNERVKLKQLVRSFGPDGGGVFTKATELEMLQADKNSGDVYFKLLEYVGEAITKVLLGQTATAGDGGGWSNDNAQAQVRQDLLEADCDSVANAVNTGLTPWWMAFNAPETAAIPKMIFRYEPPEDKKALADTVKTLYDGGFEADEEEMSERFGIKLTKKTEAAKAAAPVKDAAALSAASRERMARILADAMAMAASDDDDPDAVDLLVDRQAAEFAAGNYADDWSRRMATAVLTALDNDNDAATLMAKLESNPEFLFELFDSEALADGFEQGVYGAAAEFKAARAAEMEAKDA